MSLDTHLDLLKYLLLRRIHITAVHHTDDVWLFALQHGYCRPEDALSAPSRVALCHSYVNQNHCAKA